MDEKVVRTCFRGLGYTKALQERILGDLRKALSERNLVEGPFSVFTGALRLKLEDIAEKTGNPEFLVAYLWSRREIFGRELNSTEKALDFLLAMEHFIDATRSFKPDAEGKLVPAALKMNEGQIISLILSVSRQTRIDASLTTRQAHEGPIEPKMLDPDVDSYGSWGPATKT